jgi:hypothetical protein
VRCAPRYFENRSSFHFSEIVLRTNRGRLRSVVKSGGSHVVRAALCCFVDSDLRHRVWRFQFVIAFVTIAVAGTRRCLVVGRHSIGR